MSRAWILAGVSLTLLAGAAWSATWTLEDTTPGSILEDPGIIKDTYLIEGSPNDDGARNWEYMYADTEGGWGCCVIKFDISGVPAGLTINHVYLELYCFNTFGTRSATAYPLSEDWILRYTCYNYMDTGLWWNAGNTPFDYSPPTDDYDSSAGVQNADIIDDQYNTWDVTSVFLEWYNSTRANNGFVLMADEVPSEMKFYTVNRATVAERPKLVIEYDLPADTVVTITATNTVEGGAPGSFTIARDDSSGDLVVTVEIDPSSTAKDPADYALTGLDVGGNTVTIPDGQASVTITVNPVDDSEFEIGGETVIMDIVDTGQYTLGTPSQATCTIADNETAPDTFALWKPSDGSPSVTIPPTFEWYEAVGATRYTLLVVADGDSLDSPASPVIDVQVNAPTLQYDATGTQFDYSTIYHWRVTATNPAGDTKCNADFTFTTEADTYPPRLVRTSPGNDADISEAISITFDEPIASTDLQATVTVAPAGGGTGVGGVVSIGGLNNEVLIFTPNADLEYDTTYNVTVDESLITDAGSYIVTDVCDFSFTTRSELQGLAKGKGCVPPDGPPTRRRLHAGAMMMLLALGCVASRLRRREAARAQEHLGSV